MSKTNLYIIGYNTDYGYANWLGKTKIVKDITKADLCMGIGGSDVSAKYYNQPDSGHLRCNPQTDYYEYRDYQKAIQLGKKIVGTCKSAQWGAALAGGAIFQDVTHPGEHKVKTFDGKELLVNSLHHNMCDLSNLKEGEDYKLLAWAENLSPYHINGFGQNVSCEKEPEVVYFPKINLIGWQNHNEKMYRNSAYKETIEWSKMLLDKFMNNSL